MKHHRSLWAVIIVAIIAIFAFDIPARANDGACNGGGGACASSGSGSPSVPTPVAPAQSPIVATVPPSMRAKLRISSVASRDGYDEITFDAVCPASFDPNGLNEDNSFAKWTPTARLTMSVANPDLIGKYKSGDIFYVDFSPIAQSEQPASSSTGEPAETAV